MTQPATSTETVGGASDGARGPLGSLKLAELQKIASSMGIKGISKMRKGDLVEAIQGQRGGAARSKSATAPKSGTLRASSGEAAGAQLSVASSSTAQSVARQTAGDGADTTRAARGNDRRSGNHEGDQRRSRRDAPADGEQRSHNTDGILDDLLSTAGKSRQGRPDRDAQNRDGQNRDAQNRDAQGREEGGADRADRAASVIDDLPSASRGRDGEQRSRRQRQRDGESRNSASGAGGAAQRDGSRRQESTVELDDERGRRRRGRDRYRDRSKRGRGARGLADAGPIEDIEISEDDVLVPVAGILDVLDNYAFVRTSGYLPGSNDVYLSLAQVKKAGLRRGDAITGAIKAPKDGESNPSSNRQKFNALVRLDTVNGLNPEAARKRPDFAKLTPLYPQERLRLENSAATRLTPRVIDIVAPIGKGQRGLIVAPPKAGKTIIMQQIANAITANNPEVHLMVVLVDERPEEVTDMERTVNGEVIASTFDRPASDHTIVAELAIERAKRLVELGQDVVVLLDSLTRLSRAYNLAAPASGRILSGGVDASALYPPKRFFGAARNIEEGGSLTILASALVETGSKMDEVIFEEFKGTGNMELRLSRQLADKRIFPAVDVNASGTRREEVLLPAEELKIIYKLRRVFGGLDQQQAIELLLGKLKETKTNIEFLLQVQKTTPGSSSDESVGRTV
ncbi:transcription termination factor Rho [Rarobacter faecitabidus]|uniref:Transcription termination factor Rho n=1 Tax=Rarobacter faecitabidus TaxID=13243 RepID=A0A542ZXL7_RARFA|nr:transcription termination factor Rho [Rarobacter faecitabidus]TQL64946.1 transcription termination factor Rho [Rarobacter faecitabidus]